MYLVDANVLITANNLYYEFGRVDEFWEWFLHQSKIENVKVPLEVFEELEIGIDELSKWGSMNKEILILNEEVDYSLLKKVYREGYAPDLNSDDHSAIGADAYLVTYALSQSKDRTIVTLEKKNNKTRQNRSIPSVCTDLGIRYCDPFEFGRRLNFSTKWKDHL